MKSAEEKIKVVVESYTVRGRDKEIHEPVISDEYWTQHKNFDGSILYVKVTAAAQDRWVKVSDRLPELIDGESEAVLACTKLPLGVKNEYMYHILKGYVYRTSKFWYWREDGTQCINEITHWQPLPTAPKD